MQVMPKQSLVSSVFKKNEGRHFVTSLSPSTYIVEFSEHWTQNTPSTLVIMLNHIFGMSHKAIDPPARESLLTG